MPQRRLAERRPRDSTAQLAREIRLMSTFLPVGVTIHQSDDETNDPLNRSFYKVEKWTKDAPVSQSRLGLFLPETPVPASCPIQS